MTDGRRALPSVSSLLEFEPIRSLLDGASRTVVVDAVRRTIDAARTAPAHAPATEDQWADAVRAAVERASRPSLRRVLNGTGVVLHTNLGRAPLARSAIDAVTRVAAGFTNLEYDVDRGERGSRYVHCAGLLRELTGAEDALVVNNGAAALVLVLNTLANGRNAVVSRGELVEIGGSFRIPEIMERSGVRLTEVGTTNRTRIDDYRHAVDAETGIIVKVHRSNFALSGYVAEASASELGALAVERAIPLLHDLGSGLLLSLDAFGLSGEPTAREAVAAAGPNGLITMSGDKLLGGPQAGLILGSSAMIDRIRKNPLTRSYRVDKLTLAALEATLVLYRNPARALAEIPALAQLSAPVSALYERARAIQADVGAQHVAIVDSEASVGGGAFPTARIPSVALALSGDAVTLERRLRAGDPPLVARIANDRLTIDLRAIAPDEDTLVAGAVRRAVQ